MKGGIMMKAYRSFTGPLSSLATLRAAVDFEKTFFELISRKLSAGNAGSWIFPMMSDDL